jgi:hypothetical protein
MPLLNYQLFIFFCKFFGFGQFAELEPLRFAQFDLFFHVKHRFATAIADVNVNWAVLVAVKEKPETVLLENCWHRLRLNSFHAAVECGADEQQSNEETKGGWGQLVGRAVPYAPLVRMPTNHGAQGTRALPS